jgi:hypothetical protein
MKKLKKGRNKSGRNLLHVEQIGVKHAPPFQPPFQRARSMRSFRSFRLSGARGWPLSDSRGCSEGRCTQVTLVDAESDFYTLEEATFAKRQPNTRERRDAFLHLGMLSILGKVDERLDTRFAAIAARSRGVGS